MSATGSIGTAFLHSTITKQNEYFDGTLLQLSLLRLLGQEEITDKCQHCGKEGPGAGGTIHARVCFAQGIAGQNTIIHNRMVRAVAGCVQMCTGMKPLVESHEPFVASDDPAKHIDLLTAADAFAQTAVSYPAYGKQQMLDYTQFEEQSATHRQQASADPLQVCRSRETLKENHYGGFYNPQSFHLVTMATGSFGCIGPAYQRLISNMATEYVARRGFIADGGDMADAVARYKSRAVALIRSKLSLTLTASVSARVLKYKTMAVAIAVQDPAVLPLYHPEAPVEGMIDAHDQGYAE